MLTEIKSLKNGNLLCIETYNYLDKYLLYWHISLTKLMNGYCWLYSKTVFNITRTTPIVTKLH